MNAPLWKPDWAAAQRAFVGWWEHRGLALHVTAPKDEPREVVPEPRWIADPKVRWYDVANWADNSIYQLSRRFYGGIAFPNFNTLIGGPGSLGLFLGSIGHPAPTTMWYEPVITDPESHPPLRFTRNESWQLHTRLIDEALRRANGRYLVGYPDLIENIDVLAQLRDSQTLLVDLIERPDWVKAKVWEINDAFFAAYDAWWSRLNGQGAGAVFCAFDLWAPGKVAKVQCDFSCMISTEMFREFVVPALTAQCDWLDYSMYHLDGTNAIHHLDALLEIESLDAIEWTPQAGLPGGGSPQWYDLYRRIKAGGKSVQAIGVRPDELEPLLDAVGPDGMYVMTGCETERQARELLRRVGWPGEA
jgi:hypothetical protein